MTNALREQFRAVLTNEFRPAFSGTSVAVQRATLEAIGSQAQLPEGIVHEPATFAGVACEWERPTTAADGRVLFHHHGGGYVLGSLLSSRGIACWTAHNTRASVLVHDYRLAPEHPVPAGLDDSLAVYQALLEAGHRPEQIIFSGDSAGGGLAVGTALRARDRGLPLPKALVLMSPWVDMSLSGESMTARAELDPWLTYDMCDELRNHYLGGRDPKDPEASPVFADLSGLPPMLIQVGEHEILFSDSDRLAQSAKAAGVSVELEVGEGMWHVWQLMAPILPESNEAYARISAFVDQQFGA
ncbi:MAG: alpha/beta hydrolase [Myxococcales bacterium]|nr:alpha/beta hydrolase [Myxococcales bacterium]